LSNNTNAYILSAESALQIAEANLMTAQREHANALHDYNEGSHIAVLQAESAVRSARIDLETRQTAHEDARVLHAAGVLARHDFVQSGNALTDAQNRYADAMTNYETASTTLQRALEQSARAVADAENARTQAREMLSATRVAAGQEVDSLRGLVESAEIAANVEVMEINLQILERQLRDATITAPMNGTVTAVFATEGAIGSGILFVVEDTDDLRIMTRFREYDISRIAEGMSVTITADGTGNTAHAGVISRINPAAVTEYGVVEFEAEVTVTSSETNLRIGMSTRVQL
jgi:multidrug resistance efflux pump